MESRDTGWRRWLRRKIFWLLAFKLAALVVLWLLFFSPAHRVEVNEGVMTERLMPADPAARQPAHPDTRREDPNDV